MKKDKSNGYFPWILFSERRRGEACAFLEIEHSILERSASWVN